MFFGCPCLYLFNIDYIFLNYNFTHLNKIKWSKIYYIWILNNIIDIYFLIVKVLCVFEIYLFVFHLVYIFKIISRSL